MLLVSHPRNTAIWVLFFLTLLLMGIGTFLLNKEAEAGYACCGSNCVVCNDPTPCPTIINCGPPIQFNCNGLNSCGACGVPNCSGGGGSVQCYRCNAGGWCESYTTTGSCSTNCDSCPGGGGGGSQDPGLTCANVAGNDPLCEGKPAGSACGSGGYCAVNTNPGWNGYRACNCLGQCYSSTPTPNTLISPSNGANLPSYDTASLSWNASSGFGVGCPQSNSYVVFTSLDNTNWTNRGSTSNLTMNLTGLTSGTLYYWRVGVSNGSQTAYSPTWTFRTNSAPTVTYNGQLETDTCGQSTSGRVGGGSAWLPTTNPARFKFTVNDSEGDTPVNLYFLVVPRSLSGGVATTTIVTGQSWAISGRGLQATVQIDNPSPTASAYRILSADLVGGWTQTTTPGANHTITTSSTQVATLLNALNSNGTTASRLNANTSEYYYQLRFDNNFGSTVMGSNPTRLWDIYVAPEMRNSDGQTYMLDQWTRMTQWGVDMVSPSSVMTGPSYDASSNINITYTASDGQGIYSLSNHIIRSDPAATITDNTIGQAITFTNNLHSGSVNMTNYLTQPSRNYTTNGIPGNDFTFYYDVVDFGCNFVRSTVNAGTPSPWILSSSNNVSVNQNTVNFGSNRNITIPTITSFSLTGLPGYTYTDGASGPYLSTYGVLSGTSQTIVSPVSKISKLNRYVIDYNNEAGVPRSGTSWYDYLLPIVQSNSSPAMATFATTSETATGNAQFPQGQTYTGNISTIFGLSANGKRNLAVTGNIQLGSGTVCDVKSMIFVSGNLRISPNLTKTSGNACVFVVNGNISIAQGNSGGGILVNSATQPYYDQIEATLVSDDYVWADPDNQSQAIDLSASKWASWGFNESSGTSVSDSSGNNRNGTWVGTSPYWVAGQTGNAGNFNGSNSYVDVGNLALSGTGSLTFSMRANSTGSDHRIFSQLTGSTTQAGALRLNGGAIEVWTGSAWVNIIPGGSIAANTWYRIGVVYSGGSVTGYLNGARMNTSSSGFTFNGVSAAIGARFINTYGTSFSGLIDEFRVYNSALTGDQIATDYFYFYNDPVNLPTAQLTPTPLAHWKLNEGVGTLVSDYRYLSSNGTYQGTLGSQWVAGKYGTGLNFNGTNNLVTIPHRADLNFGSPSDPFTITAWVKTTSSAVNNAIVTKARPVATSSHMPWNLYVDSGKVKFFRWCEGGGCGGTNSVSNFSSTASVNNGQWRHIAFVSEGASSHKIYIDGALDTTNTVTWVNTVNNTEAINIGRYMNASFGTNWFSGQIDDVKIYGSALTAQQIVSSMTYSAPTVKGEGLYIRGGVITAGNFEWNRDINGIANAYHPSLVIQSDSIFSTLFKNDLWVRDYSIREQQ